MKSSSNGTLPYERAWPDGEFYLKQMCPHEANVYTSLRPHVSALHDGIPSVRTAELVEYNQETQLAVMTHVGDFPDTPLHEYFGESDRYTRQYIEVALGAFRAVRNLVPVGDVPETQDYESVQAGKISSLTYLEQDHAGGGPEAITGCYGAIRHMACATQEIIADAPLYFSHRDPNPTNYHIATNAEPSVVIIDWETSGLSRVGYDEGRLLTYFALNESAQNDLTQLMCTYYTDEQRVYFWRVAAMRAYREMISLQTGRYDARLGVRNPDDPLYCANKRRIVHGLAEMVDRALQELAPAKE